MIPMFKPTAIAFGAFALCAGPATAGVTIFSAPPYPPNPPENVLLNTDEVGSVITGMTNQTHTTVVFTGHENLLTPPQGQAWIEASDGAFNYLDIALADLLLGFTSIEFNIDAMNSGPATIHFFDNHGNMYGGSYDLGGAGSNFFTALGTGGDFMTHATISSATPIQQVGQVRLGGIQALVSSAVPEPATWLTMILGFFGLGALMRRRRGDTSALA
jgi:hypothetical protein